MALFSRIIFLFIVGLSLTLPLQAQNQLQKITVATRSDGKGYVVRVHLEKWVNYFECSQPSQSLTQVEIQSPNINLAEGWFVGELPAEIEDIYVVALEGKLGINLFLKEEAYYLATAYKDAASDDLLVALTVSDKKNVDKATKGVELKSWNIPEVDPMLTELEPVPVEPVGMEQPIQEKNYDVVRDKVKFDVVVIDPGHGGKDPGALGYRKTQEKDIALKVALKLGAYIEEYLPDVKVVYTRKDDRFIGLSERGTIANNAEGDLFISLHCNAFRNRSVKGTEVFFLGMHRSEAAKEVMLRENSVVQFEMENEQKSTLSADDLAVYELMHSGFIAGGQQFAFAVDQQFTQRVQRPSRGVKQAGFVVLWHAAMPSVLVELGFITNPTEEKYLNSEYGQTMLASGLFRAVRDYKVEFERTQHLSNN